VKRTYDFFLISLIRVASFRGRTSFGGTFPKCFFCQGYTWVMPKGKCIWWARWGMAAQQFQVLAQVVEGMGRSASIASTALGWALTAAESAYSGSTHWSPRTNHKMVTFRRNQVGSVHTGIGGVPSSHISHAQGRVPRVTVGRTLMAVL
jgi:hypothetical protein